MACGTSARLARLPALPSGSTIGPRSWVVAVTRSCGPPVGAWWTWGPSAGAPVVPTRSTKLAVSWGPARPERPTPAGTHSAAVALTDEEGGTFWIAGHSHDASGRMRAVLWAVRLG